MRQKNTAAEEYAIENGFNFVDIEGHEHTFGSWKVITPSTIYTEGLEQRKCTACAVTEERTIQKKEAITSFDSKSNVSVSFGEDAFGGKTATVSVFDDLTGTQDIAREYERFVSINISAYVDGEKAQPNVPVVVRIPLPVGFDANKITVYHINSVTGITEEIAGVTVEDGYLSFYTPSFSVFVIADETSYAEKKNEQNPPEEEDKESCTCKCHKTGFMGFIWKIVNFFNRLFRKNQYCECGAKHW